MARPSNVVPFFRVWTPQMAYVLGYWWADGCMRIKRGTRAHEVSIASNDREHLIVIANAIGATYHLKKVAPTSNTYVAAFCSTEMYADLLRHGGTPKKSADLWMPDVPPELLPHFVRGVVDGDGTLSWNAGKPVLHIYSVSREFLEGIAEEIDVAAGIPAPHIVSVANRTTKHLKWSTMRAKCLAAWLYVDNAGLMLERKAAIAAQFIEWQPKKRPEKGTITEKMRLRYANYLPTV